MQYNQGFKKQSLALLERLNENGELNIKGMVIRNVRELVSHLGISSYTLYAWKKEFSGEEEVVIKKQKTSKKAETENYFDNAKETIKSDKKGETMVMILDNTFFMSMARGLGIKNYRKPQKQLWLEVGNELIKRSGLVESQKKVIKELKIKEVDEDW